MVINWKDDNLKFMMYIRKYKQIIARSDDDTANQQMIIDIEDGVLEEMSLYAIPIDIRKSCNDT